jgi:Na+-driven multidrug efflux pump
MFGGMGVFGALFMGYSSGVAPIISYNYGKGDTENLKRVYANSLWIVGILSTLSIGLAWLLTNPIISVYDVPMGTDMHDMAFTGFRIITVGFVFMGFNTFSSMMFTALNNGLVSALLSFFRTLVFVVISFLILPKIFGLNGAWAAMPFAELLGLAMTIFFFKKMKKVYHYA